MKLLTASLCFICVPLLGQGNIQDANRPASVQTLKSLEEQLAQANQQAADAEKRAADLAAQVQQAKFAVRRETASDKELWKETAQDIQRDGQVVHLKGNVRIVTERFSVSADEADRHMDTGEIEARGNVHIVPMPTQSK